ncbi:MAG: alanine racemase [Rickettsiaceae bacterium]
MKLANLCKAVSSSDDYQNDCCRLEINLSNICSNYLTISAMCSTASLASVVKSNAYSLGANKIAPALESVGCSIFFVASFKEAMSLRGYLKNSSYIYVLNGIFQGQESDFINNNLIPVINNLWQLNIWNQFAKYLHKKLSCILHFDTGMNRLGLTHNQIIKIINDDNLIDGLQFAYIMSHLSCGHNAHHLHNKQQLDKFQNYLNYFPSSKSSLANSAVLSLGPEYHFDMVRIGAALYGLEKARKEKNSDIKSVISLNAPIIQLNSIPKDSHIGYDLTFTANSNRLIATLPLGYGDGYPIEASNIGKAYIQGYEAKIVGRVSMDLVNIDVTDVPNELLFIGQQVSLISPHYTIQDLADDINISCYNVLINLMSNRYDIIYKYND